MSLPVENPLAYYAALSLAMSACIYLFISVKKDLQGVRYTLEARLGRAEADIGQSGCQLACFETKLGEWADRTKEVEDRFHALAGTRRKQALAGGIDANQRTQVMRLARRGDRPEQIAAELGVPRNEVDLLLKVQRAVVRAF